MFQKHLKSMMYRSLQIVHEVFKTQLTYRYIRFPQNGHYAFESFLQKTETKNHSIQEL